MKRAYVVGHPVRHSVSPAIHNAAFAALGIDARYEAADVPPESLASWVRAARGADVLGFSVTIPHKETIVPLLDEIAGDATLVGAVSGVVAEHARQPEPVEGLARTRLIGLSTDTVGFRRSLKEEAGVELGGKRVVLLGAGGAARAAAVVALQDAAASLVVANRHLERAEGLLNALRGVSAETTSSAVDLRSDELADAMARADVVVNATSVGLGSQETPIDPNLVTPRSLVVDLIYNPRETALLRATRARGAETLGGLGMLIYQAAVAFEAWTGAKPPIDVMRHAAEQALDSQTVP
jgi:shikimate dehydrogenase